jgi:flavin reductase (NADH)/flavin reductase
MPNTINQWRDGQWRDGQWRDGQLRDWQSPAHLAALEAVDPQTHRGAMRHFASPVTVVTSSKDGDPVGLTATAVCSVTADPPRIVVFINKQTLADSAIMATGAVCVNVLAGDQEEVARAFAGMIPGVIGPARFDHGRWGELVTGAPVLDGALVAIDCRVIKVFEESTHHAFLCEILATRERGPGDGPDDSAALLYCNGAFHHLPHT